MPEPAALPRHVLLVVDSLQCGGAERYVVDLALTLRRQGVGVSVACSVAGPFAAELEAAAVPVHALMPALVKRRFSPAFAARLRRLIRTQRIDLVHAHIYASATASAAALARTPVSLVLTEHTEAPWRGRTDRWISRVAYLRADHIVAVSTPIRDDLCTRFGVAPERVTYVPNAIPEIRTPLAEPLPAADGGALLIGRVARLEPEKGIDRFIHAAAAIGERAPRAEFLVVGEGPLEDDLRRLARELGIADRVHFLGRRDDARAVIERLDLLAVSSITDGSPLVVLEAMSAGVPVVATATGGLPDQIEHGVNGLLVPPGDAPALAAAMLRLIDDLDEARRFADAGRRRFAAEFSYDAMVGRVLRAYAAAVRRRVPAGRRASGVDLTMAQDDAAARV